MWRYRLNLEKLTSTDVRRVVIALINHGMALNFSAKNARCRTDTKRLQQLQADADDTFRVLDLLTDGERGCRIDETEQES